MTNEKIVVLQVRFTRTRALMALALFFLCWHPKPLGSETLQLTTYYPAPYGGYVSILTTGNTYLARDSGTVGIGFPASVTPRRKLDVNGEIVAVNRMTLAQNTDLVSPTWHIDNSGGRFRVFNQPNINASGSERVTVLSNGNVGINSAAPSERLSVAGNLGVTGDVLVNGGWLQGLCTEVAFGGGTSWCPGGRRVMGQYGTGRCYVGNLFLGGTLESGGRWVPHYEQGCTGTMLCCYIRNY
ncbi:MAG: hypothetical protein A2049_06780 [Elusimicrobia bacterium GWA2_62_23]|nr:MAG: hypothetical protein A2049_06780 [Elusimicrobia bacterium GWA2_62_23]OGR70756.1 MAG: hypothetical protein A2179_04155 [Elusimicrobia bacterium GWC2_63_65]